MPERRRNTDRPYLWLVRRPQGLVPASEFDSDMLDRYRIGANVVCTIEQPVDDSIDRKFHGLVNAVANGCGDDFETTKTILMLKAGCIRGATHIEGYGTSIARKSVRDLEGAEYEEMYRRVVEIVLAEYLPFMTRQDIIERIEKYIGVR